MTRSPQPPKELEEKISRCIKNKEFMGMKQEECPYASIQNDCPHYDAGLCYAEGYYLEFPDRDWH